MAYEPSPEGRIGRKKLKTRTPGREDTSLADPASPAEESNASGATGGPLCTVQGVWQVPALEIDPAQLTGALPVRYTDPLQLPDATPLPTPATSLLIPTAPARGLAAMGRFQRNSGQVL